MSALLAPASPPIVVGDLVVDEDAYSVQRNGVPIELTRREFLMLATLARNANRVITRDALMDHLWVDEVIAPNTIEVYVYKIRRKLEAHGPRLIFNIRGVGYVLRPDYSTRPEIVVLCGSSRFGDAFAQANLDLTLAGKIVLSIGCVTSSDSELGIDEDVKAQLDELHKRKIDLADRVLVLNVDGYVGESTRSEIEYATKLGRPVDYLEPDQAVTS